MAKIMIIDDDRELLESLSTALSGPELTVLTSDSVDGAVEHIKSANPDLLVLDVMFPGNPAGGFDLARALRAEAGLKGLPIILLTSINQELPTDFSRADIDEEWFPVQELLEKPVPLATLRARIRELLGKTG